MLTGAKMGKNYQKPKVTEKNEKEKNYFEEL